MKTIIKPTITEDNAWTPKAALRPLTRKQKVFTKHMIDNPKASATEAALAAYNTTSPAVAAVIATENLRKPNILTELAKYQSNAELTLIEVMNTSKEYSRQFSKEGAAYASVAVQSANSILDRLLGKATIKHDITSTAVTLNIDLTGVAQPSVEK